MWERVLLSTKMLSTESVFSLRSDRILSIISFSLLGSLLASLLLHSTLMIKYFFFSIIFLSKVYASSIPTRRLIASACTSVRGCLLVCQGTRAVFQQSRTKPMGKRKYGDPAASPTRPSAQTLGAHSTLGIFLPSGHYSGCPLCSD